MLTTGAFIAEKNNLFKIDSLTLHGRVTGYKGIYLTTTDDFKLYLEKAHYYAIDDPDELRDTLMDQATTFSIYTNKEGFEDYHEGRTENRIEIYRIIIGTKEYTNPSLSNERAVKSKYTEVIMEFIMAIFFIHCGLKRNL